MNNLVQTTISFIQAHQAWAFLLVLALAFCESFAFVSLLVPATAILLGVGALIAAAELAFWPIWAGAVLGATAGDWLAYDLSFRARHQVDRFRAHRGDLKALKDAIALFERWGMMAVFVGRFFGPLRAIVPIAAGVCAMPWLKFQIANVASALVWATAVLTPGFLGVRWLVG